MGTDWKFLPVLWNVQLSGMSCDKVGGDRQCGSTMHSYFLLLLPFLPLSSSSLKAKCLSWLHVELNACILIFGICETVVMAPGNLNSLFTIIYRMLYVSPPQKMLHSNKMNLWCWLLMSRKLWVHGIQIGPTPILALKNYGRGGCWLSLDLKMMIFSVSLRELSGAERAWCYQRARIGSYLSHKLAV